jgi:hypothetical protein
MDRVFSTRLLADRLPGALPQADMGARAIGALVEAVLFKAIDFRSLQSRDLKFLSHFYATAGAVQPGFLFVGQSWGWVG